MEPILVVDDNQSSARTLKRLLEIEGFRVGIASNRAEALKILAAEDFGLVFLDLILPNASGLDLLEEIRTAKPHTRIFAMSGDEKLLAGAAGADAILPKPLTAAGIATALQNAGLI